MTNYDIFNVEEQDVKLVIVMKTSESPFDYAADIQEQLKNRGFVGTFLIDELLHSGNTDERFIKGRNLIKESLLLNKLHEETR